MPRYAGRIIDAHHHLWDLGLGRHPWLAGTAGDRGGLGGLAPIRRDYLPRDYGRDARNQRIVATVHVEAGWRADDCLGETRWLETLDGSGGIASRYVVHVPLASAEAPALIEAQAAFARVAGVRDIVSRHPEPARSFADRPDKMDDPAWRAGLARLAGQGLSFDLMLFPSQLPAALRLAMAFPDLQFIVNHGGSPIDRDAEGMARWRMGIAALAAVPNVAIKVSDLVAYDPGWTLASLRPVILHCIDSFGPDRCMFASDFPVAGLYAGFDDVYDTFRSVVADFAAVDQRALFFETARRLYRVPVED